MVMVPKHKNKFYINLKIIAAVIKAVLTYVRWAFTFPFSKIIFVTDLK